MNAKPLAALACLALAACNDAGDVGRLCADLQDTNCLDAATELQSGVRVYEFTPKTSAGRQCVFVSAAGKGGLDCFPK